MPKRGVASVHGDVLPSLGKARYGVMQGSGISDAAVLYAAHKLLGSGSARRAGAMSRNSTRVAQSVIKRVGAGGCHDKVQLKRQLNYVAREEGVEATWANRDGYDRNVSDRYLKTVVEEWGDGWKGAPKRGHTDHIILSFPKGTDIEKAEAIAREWGQEVFGSGNYGDRWAYVAGLHRDGAYEYDGGIKHAGAVHAHFVVNKRGMDDAQFLSISQKSTLNYEMMRELHAHISREHGVAMNASSRLSRGIVEYDANQMEHRKAREEGREVVTPQMSSAELVRRQAILKDFQKQYEWMSEHSASFGAEGARQMVKAFNDAAKQLSKGDILEMNTDGGIIDTSDIADRMAQLQSDYLETMQNTWNNIRSLEPGAERAAFENEFMAHIRDGDILNRDPALVGFTTDADGDSFMNDKIDALQRLSPTEADLDREEWKTIAIEEENIRARLTASLQGMEERLAAANTSVDEVVERYLSEHPSVTQVEAWRKDALDAGMSEAEYANLEADIQQTVDAELRDYEFSAETEQALESLEEERRRERSHAVDDELSL